MNDNENPNPPAKPREVVQDAFLKYAALVLPPTAPMEVRVHMRQALFFGAQELMAALLETAEKLPDGKLKFDDDVINDAVAEIVTFFAEQKMIAEHAQKSGGAAPSIIMPDKPKLITH